MASSSRKVGSSKWKQGQRRSPRLSVTQGPNKAIASARKTRKLSPLQHVPTTSLSPFSNQTNDVQGSNRQRNEDHRISTDQPTSQQGDSSPKLYDHKASSPEWMPEKRILELILDILQRRDTYEIFAEPVDPEEVEDYYEVVKEPMDFGTMRAKLHEGMYTSLQQFEHDVYLIPRNAMHFNSQTTIYFRQARAIYELAKRVFDSLKTDPENFELEFSETKRRTSRRLMCEAAKSPSSSKLGTNLRPNTNPSPKSVRGIGQRSGAATGFDARDYGVHSSRRTSYGEADRRSTYTPWTSRLTENASPDYIDSKPLIQVNQRDISYRDSLMMFVKDLGPTARMVAERKLMGCSVDDRVTGCRNPIPDCALTRESVNANNNSRVDAAEKVCGRGQMVMSSLELGSSSRDERKKSVDVFGFERLNQGELGSKLAPRTGENTLDLRWEKDEVEARNGYTFDLSFLKKRLHDIKFIGK